MQSGVKYAAFHRLPPHSVDALKKAALSLPPPLPLAAPGAALPRELLPAGGGGAGAAAAAVFPGAAGFPFVVPSRGGEQDCWGLAVLRCCRHAL